MQNKMTWVSIYSTELPFSIGFFDFTCFTDVERADVYIAWRDVTDDVSSDRCLFT